MGEKIRVELAEMISRACKINKNEIEGLLEKPADPQNGDFALPCFRLVRQAHESPVEIANVIAIRMEKPDMIKMIRAVGPYVNFYINWGSVGQKILEEILERQENFGKSRGGKSVLVEHTSANPDGPLHLGHFRNTVIGDSLARILKFTGNKVKTESYVNDSGRQIAIAALEFLNTKKIPKKKSDWWVVDLYVKGSKKIKRSKKLDRQVKEFMQKYESGDKEAIKSFNAIVDNCLKGHKETLENLGVHVDHFQKESVYFFSKDVERILNRLKKKKIAKAKGKRTWVNLKKFGIEREFTLTREDGTTIYPARDLGYHKDKFARADRNINIIGTDQRFYFKQLTTVLGLLYPRDTKNYQIVFYEFLLLPQGSMSTRGGKFIAVDDVVEKSLKEAEKVTKKKLAENKERKYGKKEIQELTKTIGLGALKYAMIKVSPEKTYSFSIKDTLSFDGNTAPYIQYTHARANSILKKAKEEVKEFDANLLEDIREINLLKILMKYPEKVILSSEHLRPHYISNYAYQLASAFNEFYQAVPVLNSEDRLKDTRLALVTATKHILKSSLALLGIEAPDRM